MRIYAHKTVGVTHFIKNQGWLDSRLDQVIWVLIIFKAGGRNVDDQNVDKPKISERRNGLFS
jgi:hypothetical protein